MCIAFSALGDPYPSYLFPDWSSPRPKGPPGKLGSLDLILQQRKIKTFHWQMDLRVYTQVFSWQLQNHLVLGRAHHKVLASPVARCHLVLWPPFLRQC